jgi:enoyl-CoA hydratase/carnithine racemase
MNYSSDTVYERLGQNSQIGHIRVNKPPENLIDQSTAIFFSEISKDLNIGVSETRVIILSGLPNGPFSLGTSKDFETASHQMTGPELLELIERYSVADSIASIPHPVIAAVEGEAFDQGLEMLLAADLRIAGEGAFFRLSQIHNGTLPWDGGTQRLSRIIGSSAALEMLLSGRIIDTKEAFQIGLVNRIVPDNSSLESATELATSIANGGPIAARYAKEAVHTGMEISLEQGILLETDLTMILQTTEDRMEGIKSFLEKRRPLYRDR